MKVLQIIADAVGGKESEELTVIPFRQTKFNRIKSNSVTATCSHFRTSITKTGKKSSVTRKTSSSFLVINFVFQPLKTTKGVNNLLSQTAARGRIFAKKKKMLVHK